MNNLSKSAQNVQTQLNEKGFSYTVQELPASTRTANDAAQALNCEVAQIVKSLLFCTVSLQPVLILVSGSNRVDTQKIARLLGEAINKADADFTRKTTGFAIGGIPPLKGNIAHVFIDEDLFKFSTCWAAAGTPHAVFCLKPEDLIQLTDGQVADIRV